MARIAQCSEVLATLFWPAFLVYLVIFIAASLLGFWLQDKITRLEQLKQRRNPVGNHAG